MFVTGGLDLFCDFVNCLLSLFLGYLGLLLRILLIWFWFCEFCVFGFAVICCFLFVWVYDCGFGGFWVVFA